LLLGEYKGWLQVVDLKIFDFTSSRLFEEGDDIYDIAAIDDTQFLLATFKGLLKTTKDQLINHYYSGEMVTCLCRINDSNYLLGFNQDKLRVWNHQTEQEIYLIS
jgi:hypothetical protein